MTTKHEAAVQAIAAACEAHDWEGIIGAAVTIDATPGRSWESSEIKSLTAPVCYVSRIGRTFNRIIRDRWESYPQVAATIIYPLSATEDGQPNPESFALAESALEQILPAVLNGLDRRFGINEIDQPVGFDDDHMSQLNYVSQVVFTLNDGSGVK